MPKYIGNHTQNRFDETQLHSRRAFKGLSRLFILPIILFSAASVRADDSALYAELARKQEIYNILKADLVQIDSEMRRCNSAKKNWTAATVVGGVGVVGTGIGAIVQHNQIQNKKKELESLNQQLRNN